MVELFYRGKTLMRKVVMGKYLCWLVGFVATICALSVFGPMVPITDNSIVMAWLPILGSMAVGMVAMFIMFLFLTRNNK